MDYILKKPFNSVATAEGVLEQEHYPFIGTFCFLVQGNSTNLIRTFEKLKTRNFQRDTLRKINKKKTSKTFPHTIADENYISVSKHELDDLMKLDTLKKTTKHKFINLAEMTK